MPAPSTEAQNEWVRRVLGVATTPAADPTGDFRKSWTAAMESWREAVEVVDNQMEVLGVALRATGDPWMTRIGEFGLNAVTGDHKVRMMAACMDVTAASGPALAKGVATARKAIQTFAGHLGSSEQVAACDNNRLGVRTSIRSTIGQALKVLNEALARAPGGP